MAGPTFGRIARPTPRSAIHNRVPAPAEATGSDTVRDPLAGAPEARTAAQAATLGRGETLPHFDRIQQAFGKYDLSGVRSFVGGPASVACDALNASAFAFGDAVAFRSQPSLATAAHEAAHVVQHRAGWAPRGADSRGSKMLEWHAHAVAHAVEAGESAEAILDQLTGGEAALGPAVQGLQHYTDEVHDGDEFKLSSDGQAAMFGTQELYATKKLIQAANRKLKKAGKGGSFVKLKIGDIFEYEGKDLHEVIPTWVNKGSKAGWHKGAEKANKKNGKDTEGGTGPTMALWADCGRSSAAITASHGIEDRYGVYRASGKEFLTLGEDDDSVWYDGEPNMVAADIYNTMLPRFAARYAENKSFLKKNIHYTGKPSGDALTEDQIVFPEDLAQAKHMYWKLGAKGRAKFDAEVGINHASNPQIGEAYAMSTEPEMPGYKDVSDKTWNFHWAGVIMKAGTDNITLENYAVEPSALKGTGLKSTQDYIDRAWNFEMYGTEIDKQTFHTEHLKSKTHGNRATTLRMRTLAKRPRMDEPDLVEPPAKRRRIR